MYNYKVQCSIAEPVEQKLFCEDKTEMSYSGSGDEMIFLLKFVEYFTTENLLYSSQCILFTGNVELELESELVTK